MLKCLESRGPSCPLCRQNVDEEVASESWSWSPAPQPQEGSTIFNSASHGLATIETTVAVEIAESVRRSLVED